MKVELLKMLEELRPYVRLIGEDPKTQSVEYRNVPGALCQRAMDFQINCPYDGETISPFRMRNADALRGDPKDLSAGSLYFAPSCQGRSCYQSKATSAFKDHVRHLYNMPAEVTV